MTVENSPRFYFGKVYIPNRNSKILQVYNGSINKTETIVKKIIPKIIL